MQSPSNVREFSSITRVILALLFFGMRLPASLSCALLFLLSLLCAALLAASITTLISISMLWTVSGQGVRLLVQAGVWMFAGIALPIPFFPDFLRPLIEFLPFRGIMDTPFRLYLGDIPPAAAAGVFTHQLLWLAVLVTFGRVLIARGRRRLVVQGG